MKINLQMHILREPQASSVISHHPWGAVLKPCLSISLGAGRTLQGWPPGHSELQAPPARQRLGSRLPRVKWWVLDPLLPTACRTLTCTPGGVRVFGLSAGTREAGARCQARLWSPLETGLFLAPSPPLPPALERREHRGGGPTLREGVLEKGGTERNARERGSCRPLVASITAAGGLGAKRPGS